MNSERFRDSNGITKNGNYEKFSFRILLLILIASLLPLIVRSHEYKTKLTPYGWFHEGEDAVDFFLFYKQWGLVLLGTIMLLVLVIRMCNSSNRTSFRLIFVPLLIYAGMSLISSGNSKYSQFAYSGLYDQFENIFAVLTYCLIVYYAYIFIQYESDLKILTSFLIFAMLILSIIGILQISSHDPFRTELFQKLYLSDTLYEIRDKLSFKFELNRVYLTFFNSNYVGVYSAMMIPLLTTLLYFSKKTRHFVIYAVALLGMLICLVGSKSKAGLIAVVISMLCLMFFLRKQLIQKLYLTVIGVVGGILLVCALVIPASPMYAINLRSIFQSNEKAKPLLEDIRTEKDNVSITYNGNTLKFSMYSEGQSFYGFVGFDQNDELISDISMDPSTELYYTNDPRFPGFQFLPVEIEDKLGFYIIIDEKAWCFTNQYSEDGSYQYINPYNELSEIGTPEHVLFDGHEDFASGRGYIWSRTIPLLKQTLLIGSGANTFAFMFPYSDYVGYYNYGLGNQMLTKPHSWYLQMGVESGVVAMIAMIVFFAIYLVQSIRIYAHSKFDQYSSCLGVGIFLSILSYLITALTNDSSITVAPVFWVLVGVGITINYKFHSKVNEESKEN